MLLRASVVDLGIADGSEGIIVEVLVVRERVLVRGRLDITVFKY